MQICRSRWGQSKEITLPTSHPEITFTSSDVNIVAVENGCVKGLATGSATISAAWSASEIYNAGSASFDVTVDENQFVTFNFVDKTYGMTPGADKTYGNPEISASEGYVTATISGDYCLVAATEDNPEAGTSAAPQALRIGATESTTPGNIIISVPSGERILAVEFVGNNVNKLSASEETMSGAKWTCNEGAAVESVTFTATKDCKVTAINITRYPVDSSGISTIATNDNLHVEYYNLNGVKVNQNNIQPGLYIVRQGATATKIIVK